ncbi:MAG: hypothetical protein M3Y40_04160 [Chloroflexota bacterium]|nr:hypothetical protein [Chloroflexota bacterium]
MDELRGRFQRLDRITAPNLWNEAVGRAAEMPMPRRWAFSPTMGMLAAALLLAALAGTVAVGAWLNDRLSPEADARTYENGMMVTSDGCGGLTAIDPTTFRPRTLLSTADGCPDVYVEPVAWSQDGSRLLYWRAGTGEGEAGEALWIYKSSTGATRQLDSCPEQDCFLSGGALSPDGTVVASYRLFRPPEGSLAALVLMSLESGVTTEVPINGIPEPLLFSPDGRYVAFAQRGGRSGVYLVDVSRLEDGVASEPILIHGIVEATDLAWSPDGEWIAMAQTGGFGHLTDERREPFNQQISLSGKGIVIVNTNGTDRRLLAELPTGTDGGSPLWSADSQSVTYASWATAGGMGPDLWTVPIDGGEPTRTFEGGCCVEFHVANPVRSPDGEWIAFAKEVPDDAEATGTFLVRPDGSELRRISSDVFQVVWQPIPGE